MHLLNLVGLNQIRLIIKNECSSKNHELQYDRIFQIMNSEFNLSFILVFQLLLTNFEQLPIKTPTHFPNQKANQPNDNNLKILLKDIQSACFFAHRVSTWFCCARRKEQGAKVVCLTFQIIKWKQKFYWLNKIRI